MLSIWEPFWLHEAIRRRVCVALFVLGCIVPTAGLLVWGLWRITPWHLQQQAAELERLLGLVVRLEKVAYPQPNVAIYEGVELADPDTGQSILRADQVQIRWTPAAATTRAFVGQVKLSFQGMEIYTDSLARLVELVRRALAQPAHWPRYEVQIEADQLRLRTGQQIRTASELTGFLQPLEVGTHGRLVFRWPGTQTSQPIQIRFGRDHRPKPPVSGLELALGDSAIPCSLLVGLWPGLERLGPLASIRGTLWICQHQGQVEYRFQGQLFQVDLRTVFGEELGPELSGLAQLDLEEARMLNGRLEEAAGTVRAGPGTISQRLCQAAVRELGLASSLHPLHEQQTLSYEQLAVSFRITAEGLLLRGIAPGPAPGGILVDSHRLLLGEADPSAQPIPIAALIRTLLPPERIPGPMLAPVTRQTALLLPLLPLPRAESVLAPPTLQTQPAAAFVETASRSPGQ